ncbi:MAG: hypothetical protein AAFN40_05570 [Cyanobacteria bacterium J06560_6]
MSLPPPNEKTQPTLMPDAARPTTAACRQVLRLGLGLGGTLQMLCLPALASDRTSPVQESAAESEMPPSQVEHEVYTATNHPSGNRPRLSPGSIGQGPKLSRPSSKGVNKALSQKSSPKASLLPKITPQQTVEQLPNNGASSVEFAQSLSVLDVQNLELSWGDAPATTRIGGWMSPVEELVDSPTAEGFADTTLSDVENSFPIANIGEEATEEEATEEEATENEVTEDNVIGEALDPSEAGGEAQVEPEPELYIELSRPQAESVVETPTVSSDEEDNSTNSSANSSANRRRLDLLSGILADEGVVAQVLPVLDEELGTLRMVQLRSRENEELGILRLMQTAEATLPTGKLPAAPVAILGGRLGFVNVENVFRSTERIQEQVYQSGLSLYLFPRLSEDTSLYAIADTNVARYNTFSDINDPASRGIRLDYNEIQLQAGVRHRLLPRTYAQLGWRNQRLYSPGYREKLFGVNYIDALVSHRSIVNPKVWVDSFYQMRLGFADPEDSSRFRQTFTLSLNYGVTQDLRASLLYQLDFDDYTQINRYDTYQQLLGIVSYNITPESRISFFGGTRFGRSSAPNIDLDDTFYGAGLNVSVPLF